MARIQRGNLTLQSVRLSMKHGFLDTAVLYAGHLPEPQRIELLYEVLAASQVIGDKEQQVNTLVELVPYLPELARRKTLSDGLAIVRTIENKHDQKRTLTTLAFRIAELGYSEEALKFMQYLPKQDENGNHQAAVLEKIIPYLEEPWLHEALRITQAIEDKNWRTRTLRVLLPRLAKLGYPDEAFGITQTIESENERANVLAALVPYLSKALLNQLFKIAQTIQHTTYQANVLTNLSPQLAKQGFAEKALIAAQAIGSENRRASVIVKIAPYLSESLLYQGLEVVQAVQNISSRIQALEKLAPFLSEELQKKVLDKVQELSKHIEDIQSPFGHFGPATILVGESRPPREERKLVRGAFRLAKQGSLQEALTALQTISNARYRAIELEKLPKKLKDEALHDAITILQTHSTGSVKVLNNSINEEYKPEVLSDLVPHFTELPPAILYPLWREALHILAGSKRQELLQDLGELAPVIEALGGEQAVKEAAQAVQDVGWWWT